ncbi:Cas9-type HNH domain protein [Vibrio phage 1.162.O._10N.261.48.E3]|nr:Cas9-type HNH domain protein [Vibrio phage 1.147.O._10N.286.49.E9]AUR91721.1 Cas9-type HNH domain protein [Vibrio phage 1.162.O._10N.261.48.E3]
MLIKCIKCECTFDESNFYNDKSKPNGKKPRCKACDKLSRDPEKRRVYEKEYWSDPERREKKRQQVKNSIRKNKEKHKKTRSKYLKTQAGINTQRKAGQVTRCKSKGAYIEHVDPLELYTEQNGICYMCLEQFDFKDMQMDHLIPISKGGKHEVSNVKMCCAKCNQKKGAKLPEELSY